MFSGRFSGPATSPKGCIGKYEVDVHGLTYSAAKKRDQ
jgi:hypothetical protein